MSYGIENWQIFQPEAWYYYYDDYATEINYICSCPSCMNPHLSNITLLNNWPYSPDEATGVLLDDII